MADNYQDRIVRVFISSTFRDMHAEREELVKYTFPELRRRCRERNVEFVDVDLRWGVTEEQSERGEVLPICLAEIERCHPYFIGLLGERYGWVPEVIDQDTVDKQPWLKDHREKSVTELEILHGVLENKEVDQHSFFYFRNSEVSRKVESILAKESGYLPESDISKRKQVSLKNQISKSHYPVKEYSDVKTLGKQVLDDLWIAINRQFPEGENPSQLEQTRLEHEAFAFARRKVYIDRQESFNRLDDHVNSEGPPLVVLGESGSGKSALIANWVEIYRKEHPDDFLLFHFVGGTSDSADYALLLRRIILEIKDRYDAANSSDAEIPRNSQKLIEVFPQWLAIAAAKGKFVLIIDALNQLENVDNALDLDWLPTFFPKNCRLIFTTLAGQSLEALKKRNSSVMTVKPIEDEERRLFIRDYLNQFRKNLDVHLLERIVAAPQSGNPLYLRTLLEELRIFGRHEALDEKITHYLSASTVDSLFALILKRLEKDYEQKSEYKGLVEKVMVSLWASRMGLSEVEIMELIAVPKAVWSPLHLALEESLVNRSGLLNFFHDFLRQAVEDKYLKTKKDQQLVYLTLADYFGREVTSNRAIQELAWQLHWGDQHGRLKELLGDLCFCNEALKVKRFEVSQWWSILENVMPGSYDNAFENLSKGSFEYLGYGEKKIVIYPFGESEPSDADQAESVEKQFVILKQIVDLLMDSGHYGRAEQLLVINAPYFSEPLHTKALDSQMTLILFNRGDYVASKKIIEKLLTDDEFDSINPRNQLAVVYMYEGDLDAGMELLKQNEVIICKYLDAPTSVVYRFYCENLINQGHVLLHLSKYSDAKDRLQEAEKICKQHVIPNRLVDVMGNLGVCARLMDDFGEAMRLHLRQEKLARELGQTLGVSQSLFQQGLVFEDQNLPDMALNRFESALLLANQIQSAYNLELIESGIARVT